MSALCNIAGYISATLFRDITAMVAQTFLRFYSNGSATFLRFNSNGRATFLRFYSNGRATFLRFYSNGRATFLRFYSNGRATFPKFYSNRPATFRAVGPKNKNNGILYTYIYNARVYENRRNIIIVHSMTSMCLL